MNPIMAGPSQFSILDFHSVNPDNWGKPLTFIIVLSKWVELVTFLVIQRWHTFVVNKHPVIQLENSSQLFSSDKRSTNVWKIA